MTEELRQAIQRADGAGLERLVTNDASLLERDVGLGDGSSNVVPPLHLVCDLVFRGELDGVQSLALANVLLGAGLDPDRVSAASGDTYLIAAASLGAERVGLRLVECGVDIQARGLFGATALHWASFMGLTDLVTSLVRAGGALELHDEEYRCTPLQWALYAWNSGTNGKRSELPAVVRVLVEAGAHVPASERESLGSDPDGVMAAALAGSACPGAGEPSKA